MRPDLLTLLDDCLRRGDETAFAHWRGARLVKWSYAEIARLAARFSRELARRRIAKGDRVLILARSSPEWVGAFFGCLLRGAVAVPLDPQSTPSFISRVQAQVEAKLLLDGTNLADHLLPGLVRIALDDLPRLVESHDPTLERPQADRRDLIEIVFTSGTTAEPKGVCLTHDNFLANLAPIEAESAKYMRYERLVHPIRFMSLVPASHIFGQLMGIFIPMLLGGEVYFRHSLNPAQTIEAIRRERISVLILVPRMLEALRERIERDYAAQEGGSARLSARLERAEREHFLRRWWTFRDLHRRFGWKFWAFISGGARLDPQTEEFWRLAGYAVLQGYGMTETASLISIPHPFKMVRHSIGKALPGQEVKLDESGEILIRGPNVTPGYWRGANLHAIDDEGWLHTGDLGERDEEGNIYFRGRKKDVIVLASGLKVFPEDLEAALARQPEVKEAAVIEVEGRHGPEPLAVLILRRRASRESPTQMAEDAVRRANLALGEHQHIRRWEIWPEDEFPRTVGTEKIVKRAIAERIAARGEQQQPLSHKADAPASTGSKFVREQIARISGRDPSKMQAATGPEVIDDKATLSADLQLDSLSRVELISALEEHYQVDLDEAAITASTTITDLERLVESAVVDQRPYPYPEWAQRAPAAWIRAAALYLLILPLGRLMSRLQVEGIERLRDVQGPVIFVCNHITAIDPAIILLALPARLRHRLAVAMAGELLRDWRYPVSKSGIFKRARYRIQHFLVTLLFNVFPLPQQSGFRRSFAFAGESLERGYNVLVFPEGARTKSGEMGEFRNGTGLLVAQTAAPVVPVRIDGLFELKQKGRYFARAGEIRVSFGEPVTFEPGTSAAEITAQLAESVKRLRSG